ncbi:MAG: hypothetical protein WCF50_14710, partial [Pseudolabrys sp.]
RARPPAAPSRRATIEVKGRLIGRPSYFVLRKSISSLFTAMANSVQHVSLAATGEVFLFSVCCIRQGNAICATLNHERWH